ncbi:MAG: MFS transporter [Tomitella sp.]|nr:MFS transporter [Tomitella sp.]
MPTGAVTAGSARSQRIALTTVCAVLFLTFLDTTIVSVALGDVQADLQAGVISLQWVVNAYTLVFASLMLTAGTLGDRLGRKRIMIAGMVVFCAGSLLSALASTVTLLIIGRAVMGVGAAASEPGTLSVIRHIYPQERQRAKAIGVWAAVSGVALALGPIAGGLLVGAFSWRAIFWFNVILGVVLVIAAITSVPESSDPQQGRLDLPGFVLGSTFLGCVIYAGIEGEEVGYTATNVLTLFAIGGVALIAFVLVELRAANPMFNFHYLRIPIVGSALTVAFAIYFGIFSIFFFTALYLQEVVGYSPWRTAAVFAPMAVSIVVGSLIAGVWVSRTAASRPMIAGCLLAGGGILLTRPLLHQSADFTELAAALMLAGLGFGIAVVPLTSAVLSGVPGEHSGMAAAATNTMRQVGAVIGVAALGGLVNANLTDGLKDRLRDLGIPPNFDSIIIGAVETGTVPQGAGGTAGYEQTYGSIVTKVIQATYDAFLAGLQTALLVAGLLVFVAAFVVVIGEFRQYRRRGSRSDALG